MLCVAISNCPRRPSQRSPARPLPSQGSHSAGPLPLTPGLRNGCTPHSASLFKGSGDGQGTGRILKDPVSSPPGRPRAHSPQGHLGGLHSHKEGTHYGFLLPSYSPPPDFLPQWMAQISLSFLTGGPLAIRSSRQAFAPLVPQLTHLFHGVVKPSHLAGLWVIVLTALPWFLVRDQLPVPHGPSWQSRAL